MDDPANSHDPMRASDEKDRFGRSADTTPTTNSAHKLTQFLSRKLSIWGVEEPGAYLSSLDLEFTPLITSARCTILADLQAAQIAIRSGLGIPPVAVIDRTETHFVKIFFVWLSANTNILSCVSR
jgi:hypothetical protein